MDRWLVRPWFDEGDDWPEERGAEEIVEAESEEAACADVASRYTSVARVNVRPAEEVDVARVKAKEKWLRGEE